MSHVIFSPRQVFPIFLPVIVLTLAVLACGAGQTGGEGEPLAAEPTSPLPVINPTFVPITAQPALPERRFLSLEYPPRMRAGDSDIVRLMLEVDDLGNIVPTAEKEGNVVTGKVVEFPNLYETHHVIAEARFDIAGMEVSPSELISEPISQGQTAVFYWSVRPQEVGNYRGTVWLHLRFVDKQTGEESRKAISAQVVEIEAANVLGLPASLARAVGMVGSVIGMVMSIPFFESILRLLMKKTGKKM